MERWPLIPIVARVSCPSCDAIASSLSTRRLTQFVPHPCLPSPHTHTRQRHRHGPELISRKGISVPVGDDAQFAPLIL